MIDTKKGGIIIIFIDPMVYDLEAAWKMFGGMSQDKDVNNVFFADEASHLIYSGSDDNLCKVWDMRCFRSKEKSAGILMGHLEGIAFLNSRNDGRYFISNGKNQTILGYPKNVL
ncbi:LEC14B protein [Tanacetum coccineum]